MGKKLAKAALTQNTPNCTVNLSNLSEPSQSKPPCSLVSGWTHSPWKICGKTRFEASQVVFWSLLCYKDLKLTTKLFTGRTLHGLLIQMAKLFACKVQACTGSKIFGFKKWHSSLDFYFLLSLLPTFFTFLTSFCFSFAGDLVGFILVGKVFAKPCRIFNRIRGKERLVGSGTRFSWKFLGQCFMVFCLFLWCP